jgi:hypothetical protein
VDYNNIKIEDEVDTMVTAVEQGKLRPAAKRESMSVRFAALSDIVHELQVIVKDDKELSTATGM